MATLNLCNHNWPIVFLLCSLAIFALNIASIVVNIIGIITILGINIINIYCTFFSLLTLSAELRQFKIFRPYVSAWLKYFVFLLFYKSRGIFYILYGLLLIGSGILTTVSGFLAIALGIVMVVTSVFLDLPVHEDMEQVDKMYEKKIEEFEIPSGFAARVDDTLNKGINKITKKKDKHSKGGDEPLPPQTTERTERSSDFSEVEDERENE